MSSKLLNHFSIEDYLSCVTIQNRSKIWPVLTLNPKLNQASEDTIVNVLSDISQLSCVCCVFSLIYYPLCIALSNLYKQMLEIYIMCIIDDTIKNIIYTMQISAKDIFNAINQVRANPGIALNQIKDQFKKFQSNSVYRNKKDIKVRTQSGKAGWQEAILSLERQKCKGNLAWNQILQKAVEQYANVAKQDSSVNPFQVVKSFCIYEGNISFNINQSDTEQDLIELVSVMIVGDGDQKKGSRTAIFHPLYRQFACAITKSGNKNTIYTIYAESVKQNTGQQKSANQRKQEKNSNYDNQSRSGISWNDSPLRKQPDNKNYAQKYKSEQQFTKQDYLKRGKQLITLLNKIRKQPKQYVHALKAQIAKFKDDKILVTDYGEITTKQGNGPYYDLISQLQSQYPLPTIRQVSGLSVVALQQILASDGMLIEHKIPIENLLDKFCESVQGIRSLKLKEIAGIPIADMLMRLLVGDGDRKRTARRKMLSPICKSIGCCISKDMLVANVGQIAKDRRPVVEQYFEKFMDEAKSHKSPSFDKKSQSNSVGNFNDAFSFKNNNNSPYINNMSNGDRVVIKKTSKSHNQSKAGRIYRITEIEVIYNDGQIQKIIEEQLLN